MHLDKQHPRPVYLQLKELLQNQIEQGVYLSHQQLPSERDLCQHHNLSRMTARRALQELIAEGFAYTRAGKGTFVSQNPNLRCQAFTSPADERGVSNLDSSIFNAHYRQKLMTPLLSFDCVGVERAIGEALAVHSLETVAGKLFPEIIRNLEQKWYKGEITLLVHNYAITTLRSQLIAMVNAATMPEIGPRVLLGCAPGDQHEIGLLLLALSLRRRGFLVIYLGLNLSVGEFHQVIDAALPKVICFSAATEQSARNLIDLEQQYRGQWVTDTNYKTTRLGQKPLFTFGGVAFNRNPMLISNIPGFYLGNTIKDAVSTIQNLFIM